MLKGAKIPLVAAYFNAKSKDADTFTSYRVYTRVHSIHSYLEYCLRAHYVFVQEI